MQSTNGKLSDDRLGEPSADIRGRVEQARDLQRQHFAGVAGGSDGKLTLLCNADMGPAEVRQYCPLDDAGRSLLRAAPQSAVRRERRRCYARTQAATTQLGMSARAFHRTRSVKLARTIADLEGVAEIKTHHLAEAIQYRPRRQV